MSRFVRFLALAAGLALSTPGQEPLDYPALLHRLVDVDWLFRVPVAGERCVQFSSYDRRSDRGPDDPAAYYANDDRGNYLRVVERDGVTEHVMVAVGGPGCLARLWSANPSGTLWFDVDGERVWAVDFAALCRGEVDGVPEPLAGMRSRGGNLYLPIPFGRHLTVSASAGDLYYLADVVRFSAGTEVPSFSPRLLVAEADAVAATARRLAEHPAPFATELFVPAATKKVEAGRVVRRVRIGFGDGLTQEEQLEVLGRALLVVRCGDEETVRVPMAAFFAAGPGWTPHVGRFLVVSERSATCLFPMPMPEGGSVAIETEGELGAFAPTISYVDTEPLADDAPLLFRAGYHLVQGTPTRPFTDHLVLDAAGPGRFVGCALLVRNPSRIWWGEGDEKVWVDGEAKPSWFGTGTEDYFGYAWCDPTPFQAPFHAQVRCDGPMNFGFTQLLRTHALDAIPFRRSFRMELERWHWVQDAAIDYETVAYWYGAPGAVAHLPPVPPAAARRLEPLAPPEMFVAERALEGEALRVVACSGGVHEVQDLSFFEAAFSRDAHRWWRDGAAGDALVLAVPVPATGRYRVTLAMTQADDFGVVRITLGGHELAARFDGYAERVRTTGPIDRGVVPLQAGEAELRFELLGRNELAKPRHMVGLDYLRLERVE